MDNNKEMSAEEAAQRLGVDPRTLMNYYRRGWIEGRQDWAGMQRRYYFTPEAIVACAQRLAEERAKVATE